MLGGNFQDTTSYNTDAMKDLQDTILTIKNQFLNLKAELKSNVIDIRNYWNDKEQADRDIYDLFKSNYEEFDKVLDTADSLMEKYLKKIETQINKYGDAGVGAKKSILNNSIK